MNKPRGGAFLRNLNAIHKAHIDVKSKKYGFDFEAERPKVADLTPQKSFDIKVIKPN